MSVISISSSVSSSSSAPSGRSSDSVTASLVGLRSQPPVIGVLCIDVAKELSELYGARFKSYIAASYVKFLEGAGAQVVPIWIGQPAQYYEDIMRKLNGVLIPGGSVFITTDNNSVLEPALRNDCVASSRHIYEIAARQNEHGMYFPVWGTCLGYELLVIQSAGGLDVRQECRTMRHSLPLDMAEGFQQSHMFMHLKTDIQKLMKQEPFAYHYHRYCITRNDLRKYNIASLWRVLATNKDENGLEFISLIEHTRYPFYGAQFHPERVAYELNGPRDACAHSAPCIEAASALAKFFVDECRRNGNRFESVSEEIRHHIFNYPVHYSGRHGLHWTQVYLFEENPRYTEDKRTEPIPIVRASNLHDMDSCN